MLKKIIPIIFLIILFSNIYAFEIENLATNFDVEQMSSTSFSNVVAIEQTVIGDINSTNFNTQIGWLFSTNQFQKQQIITPINSKVCDLDLTTSFYIGQYLRISLTGFDTNGSQLIQADLNVYNAEQPILLNQNLQFVDNRLSFLSSEKTTRNNPLTIVVKASDCLVSKIIQ